MSMRRKLAAAATLAVMITSTLDAGLPTGGDYTITRSTIDGGGGVSTGGDFALTGTIGQPDASVQASAGSNWQVAGGFWARISDFAELIFKNGFEE